MAYMLATAAVDSSRGASDETVVILAARLTAKVAARWIRFTGINVVHVVSRNASM